MHFSSALLCATLCACGVSSAAVADWKTTSSSKHSSTPTSTKHSSTSSKHSTISTSTKHSTTSTSSEHTTSTSSYKTTSTSTKTTSSATCTPTIATFDDLATLPGLSELSPVGTYQGLIFSGFDVLEAGVNGQNAVLPQSGINVAANGNVDDLTSSPSINASSSIKSFDLKYLYFGCVVDTEETLASTPEDCTVSFTAFKAGSKAAYQTLDYSFTPSALEDAPMVQAVFPSNWTLLSLVEVAVVESTSTSTLTGLLVDNVYHCNHA